LLYIYEKTHNTLFCHGKILYAAALKLQSVMDEIRTLHVSPNASECGNGGPLSPACLAMAVQIASKESTKTIIHLQAGTYAIPEPMRFGPEMSHVEFRAQTGNPVVFDGGGVISDWSEVEIDLLQSTSQKVWASDVSQLTSSHGEFKFFSANGQPRERCRYPAKEQISAAKTKSHLDCVLPESVTRFQETDDWELVLFYDWVCRRLAIKGTNNEGIDFVHDKTTWGKEAVFFIENMPLEFLSPGKWKLEKDSQTLYYFPIEGESLEQFQATAALAPRLLELRGNPETGNYVEDLVFDGITFCHTGDTARVNSNQADWSCSAAITLTGALNCRFDNCTFSNLSGWAISLQDGCRTNTIADCRFENLGAGGIMANGSTVPGHPGVTGLNRFMRNTFSHGGLTWGGAVAILLRHSPGNLVDDNEISYFRYTGISCGWKWGYGENISRDNIISNNHIHHLGSDRLLVDMGGIYTLGIQPGTVIRGNLIHDISGKSISWGIYLDEGSTDILVEENLVYHVASECFHVHYGRNNLVRNNVFGFAADGICSITRGTMDMDCQFTPGDKAATLENNILLSAGSPFYVKYILDYDIKEDLHCFAANNNLLHAIRSEKPVVAADGYHCFEHSYQETFDFDGWKELGFDENSILIGPDQPEIPSNILRQNANPEAARLYALLMQEVMENGQLPNH